MTQAPALVVAEHLGLRTREGAVFTDVTARVERAALTVVLGPAGAGRTALLLALCGRMGGCTGTVRLGAAQGRRDAARQWRARTAVARISDLVAPEGQLTVAESVTERALIEGVRGSAADRAFAAAEETLRCAFDRRLLVDQLGAYDRTALAVALALVRPSDLVVLDDLDRGLDLADQRRLLDALLRVAAGGTAVLTSTTEGSVIPPVARVVDLRPAPAVPSAPQDS